MSDEPRRTLPLADMAERGVFTGSGNLSFTPLSGPPSDNHENVIRRFTLRSARPDFSAISTTYRRHG